MGQEDETNEWTARSSTLVFYHPLSSSSLLSLLLIASLTAPASVSL